MLHNLKEIYGSKLAALDGEIGVVKDFYFDDQTWVIRYLVADTGFRLAGRLVLLSPHAFGKWDQYEKTLHLKLQQKQIEHSPSLESHRPISRPFETEYHRYYGWPDYWEDGATGKDERERRRLRSGDANHLQSTRAMTGYRLQTADGVLGQVSGFLVNDRSWAIRRLIVATDPGSGGREIQLAPERITHLSFPEAKIFVDLTAAELQQTAENSLVQAGSGNQGGGNPSE